VQGIICKIEDVIIRYYVEQHFVLDVMKAKDDQEDEDSAALALYNGVLEGFEELQIKGASYSNNVFSSRLFDPDKVNLYFDNAVMPVPSPESRHLPTSVSPHPARRVCSMRLKPGSVSA
jgi:hypothetical protein